MKKFLKVILWILVAVIVIALGYFGYVLLTYKRIPDKQPIHADIVSSEVISVNKGYTILTSNIGYGSYPPSYSFFMDGGIESRAYSADNVKYNIRGIGDALYGENADILLLQEVDTEATRSWKVNEYDMLCSRFSAMNHLFAVNYDSAYLFYPFHQPIGKSKSGLVVFSRFTLSNSLRRSFPISESFSKLIDLDRCYTVSEIPVSNGKILYLYNVHLTAFGGSEDISNAQLTMLSQDMAEKVANGNYVICGGDFNHDFTGTSVSSLNSDGTTYAWTQPLPTVYLPENIQPCTDYANGLVPTCRNLDKPYEPGTSFVVVLDGFLVSSNITCTKVENLDWGFLYSDHNPVRMEFYLAG